MKIGKLDLETVVPTDLKASLLEANGCSPAETAVLLKSFPLASTVAIALIPFLKEPPPVATLAAAIAKEGVDVIAPVVLAMYMEAPGGKKAH